MRTKNYMVYAYENQYQGLHGINDYYFMNGTQEEAEEAGKQLSSDLIYCYGLWEDYLDDLEDIGEEHSSEELDQMQEDFFEENIAYSIVELEDNVNLKRLEEKVGEYDYDDFREMYGIRCI